MKKKFLVALSAILVIGMATSIFQYMKKNTSHRNKPKKVSVSATPYPLDLEDDEPPVTAESRPETIEELRYQDATKISSYVQNKEYYTSDKKLMKAIKGIISRLSPNEMTHPPLPKDSKDTLLGAWTALDVHDEKGLLYNFLLTNLGGGDVVYVKGGKYSFYCNIEEADITRFQGVYEKIYNKYAHAPNEE